MAGQPLVSSATLSIFLYSVSASGTLFLSAMTGVNEDGVITIADHTSNASLSPIGSFAVTTLGGYTFFTFDVAGALNFDVSNARPFSGFVLSFTGNGAVDGNDNSFGTAPSITFTAIPEPGTMALFSIGLLGMGTGYRIRRRKQKTTA